MPPVKPITLNARTPQVECIGAVRLTPEAERVVRLRGELQDRPPHPPDRL